MFVWTFTFESRIKNTTTSLPIVVETRSRSCIVHRPLLAETPSVTFAGIHGFELCFLSRRDEMSMLFEILDDLLADHFTFKAAQCAFDRFVIIN